MYTIKTEENPKPKYMDYKFTFTCAQQVVVKKTCDAAKWFIIEAGIENFQFDETIEIQAKMKKSVTRYLEKNKKTPVETKPAIPVETPNIIDHNGEEPKAEPVATKENQSDSNFFTSHYLDEDGTEITVVTNAPEYCNPLIIK